MNTMQIVALKIHKINIQTNSIDELTYKNTNSDFDKYINDIITDVLKSDKTRSHKFISETSEMYTLITRSMFQDKFNESVERSSQRLLAEEAKAQIKIARLQKEIQKGILIQTHLKHDNFEKFIICKADDSPYIDEETLKLSNGYPLKRKIFKSCLVTFDNSNAIQSTDVYDLTSASYWHSEYLELEPLLDDHENTERAFNAIDNAIFSKIKKDSDSDHWELRNALIAKMKTKASFDIIDYAENHIRNYTPTNSSLDMDKLANKIKELPKKHDFDSVFELEPKAITAKTKKMTVALTENIDLTIKDSIDTSNTIQPYLADNKSKYILIRSDKGYDTFFRAKN